MQLELTVTNIEKSTLWDTGPIYDDRKNRKTGGNFNHEGHATWSQIFTYLCRHFSKSLILQEIMADRFFPNENDFDIFCRVRQYFNISSSQYDASHLNLMVILE